MDNILMIRNCSKCNKEISYKNKKCYENAIINNSVCASCKQLGHKVSKETKQKIKNKQIQFYNNHPEAKDHLRNMYLGKTYEQMYGVNESDRIKAIHSKNSSGKNNFFYGKSLHDVYITKYGKEFGEIKWKETIKKMSDKSSGVNNNQYGKPSPQGSGNGWSGWYKNWYFRSLHELSYMVGVIERFNLQWKSMESKNTKIPYINWEGTNRTYFADFLINNKYVVEIKPKKLWNSPQVLTKKKYALDWCSKNGYIYKLTCVPKITIEEIKKLKSSGELKFLKKYEEKFNKRYEN